jgi:hypothetical protein
MCSHSPDFSLEVYALLRKGQQSLQDSFSPARVLSSQRDAPKYLKQGRQITGIRGEGEKGMCSKSVHLEK